MTDPQADHDKPLNDSSVDLFEDYDEFNTIPESNIISGSDITKGTNSFHHDISSTSSQGQIRRLIRGTLECPFCFSSHPDSQTLTLHVQSNHPDNDSHISPATRNSLSNDVIEVSPSDDDRLMCLYCSIPFQSSTDLAKHLTESHIQDVDHDELQDLVQNLNMILCPMCPHICTSETEMQWHIEVQHISQRPSTSANPGPGPEVSVCPMCGLEEADQDILASHIELHFQSPGKQNNSSQSSSSTSSGHDLRQTSSSALSLTQKVKGKDKTKPKGNHYKHQYRQGLENAVAKGKITPGDYYDQMARMSENDVLAGVDDGHSRIVGLIDHLQRFYARQSRPGQRIFLCSPADYFCGSYGDKGWGCGYRNFQMLLSCLIRLELYSQQLVSGGHTDIPSVPKIQAMIESAWQKGFDREGCQQLKGKLVHTNKWIGATEIVATLSSMGLRCELVDFPRASSPDGTHPRLFDWVVDYFTKQQASQPLLYLQHQGHSRSIVGVEQDKGTARLLLFDPGSSYDHVTSLKTGPLTWKLMGSFRRNLSAFKAKQYQIVAVRGILRRDEVEASKRLTSTRIL